MLAERVKCGIIIKGDDYAETGKIEKQFGNLSCNVAWDKRATDI